MRRRGIRPGQAGISKRASKESGKKRLCAPRSSSYVIAISPSPFGMTREPLRACGLGRSPSPPRASDSVRLCLFLSWQLSVIEMGGGPAGLTFNTSASAYNIQHSPKFHQPPRDRVHSEAFNFCSAWLSLFEHRPRPKSYCSDARLQDSLT